MSKIKPISPMLAVSQACDKYAIRPELSSVSVDAGGYTATNTFTLLHYSSTVTENDHGIFQLFASNKRLVLPVKLSGEYQYPNWRAIVPGDPVYSETVPVKNIERLYNIVAKLPENTPVNLYQDMQFAIVSDQQAFTETTPSFITTARVHAGDLAIASKYILQPIAGDTTKSTVTIFYNGDNKPLKLTDINKLVLIMPVV